MPKYSEIEDVNEVLKHMQTIYPHNGLSLKLLSFKVVMLLAFVPGQCCQTLHSLTTRDMKVIQEKVVFIVSELMKTSKSGKQCTTLEFQSSDTDPRLCLVSCLKKYLDRTANMRQDHQKLLVSFQKPHKAIS